MAKRKIFSAEQILMKLREAEVLLATGKSTKRKLVECWKSVNRPTIADGRNTGDWIRSKPGNSKNWKRKTDA